MTTSITQSSSSPSFSLPSTIASQSTSTILSMPPVIPATRFSLDIDSMRSHGTTLSPQYSSQSSDSASSTSTSWLLVPKLSAPKSPERDSEDLHLENLFKVFEGRAAISFRGPLGVSSIGNTYVVAGYHSRKSIVFLAHINTNTYIPSLSSRLRVLNKCAGGSRKKNILRKFNWVIAGGWKDYPPSLKEGKVILKTLRNNRIPRKKIDLSKFQIKSGRRLSQQDDSDESLQNNYFLGAYITPQEGVLREFQKSPRSFQLLNDTLKDARIATVVESQYRLWAYKVGMGIRERLTTTIRLPIRLKIVAKDKK